MMELSSSAVGRLSRREDGEEEEEEEWRQFGGQNTESEAEPGEITIPTDEGIVVVVAAAVVVAAVVVAVV